MTNGTPLEKILPKYGKRCPHVHYSGRRCGSRIALKLAACPSHLGLNHRGDEKCPECRSMKEAFRPLRGW